jgi:hypothetical protein
MVRWMFLCRGYVRKDFIPWWTLYRLNKYHHEFKRYSWPTNTSDYYQWTSSQLCSEYASTLAHPSCLSISWTTSWCSRSLRQNVRSKPLTQNYRRLSSQTSFPRKPTWWKWWANIRRYYGFFFWVREKHGHAKSLAPYYQRNFFLQSILLRIWLLMT